LFGSYAEGRQRPDSDIDLAVVSRDFGNNRVAEGSLLNFVATQIEPRFEAIPITLVDYLDPFSISPILHQIKVKGTNLI
jgi:predicted nucleotidyltransferase